MGTERAPGSRTGCYGDRQKSPPRGAMMNSFNTEAAQTAFGSRVTIIVPRDLGAALRWARGRLPAAGPESPSLTTRIRPDTSLRARDIARKNAAASGGGKRMHLVACDLVSGIGRRVPLVVANLPYIPTAQIEHLEPEVRIHEPRSALDGGPDGTGPN